MQRLYPKWLRTLAQPNIPMLSILECGQMEHARTARPGLTLDKIVLSVTLLAPLCLTLTVQAAALGLAQLLAITREHRCCCTISQPTRKRRFAKILQPTRKCRFATLLLCSLHASAGLHRGFLQSTHSAG